MKRIIGLVLAVVMLIGLYPGNVGKVYAADETATIVLNGNKTINPSSESNYRNKTIVVKGTGTLTVKGNWDTRGLTIDENAKVVIADGYLDVQGKLYVGKNASLDVNSTSTASNDYQPVLWVIKDFDLYGTVKVTSKKFGLRLYYGALNLYGNLDITNTGTSSTLYLNHGALNVYSGNLTVNAPNSEGIYANNDNRNTLNIYGGIINVSSKYEAINVEYLNIEDGNINLEIADTKNSPIVLSRQPITISDGVKLETPNAVKNVNLNGKHIGDCGYLYDVYTLCDGGDNYISKLVIKEKEKPKASTGGSTGGSSGSSAGGSAGGSSAGGSSTGSGSSAASTQSGYSNEWVGGKWYNSKGVCDYSGTLTWKSNSSGWWVEDSAGWYPVSQWQKIDGKWYYFTESGYMDYSEYRDGYWLGSDGAMVSGYKGEWKSNSTGWWFEDTSGWYPYSQWLWIDGSCYYFGADGYIKTNTYVDGCWLGADGAWVK